MDDPNEITRSALRRIMLAAEDILRGEDDPETVAQDIQRMAINGLEGAEIYPWSHKDQTPSQTWGEKS